MSDTDLILPVVNRLLVPRPPLEYRAYYNDDGSIITYATDVLDHKFIVITKDEYNQARHDAKVIGDKLVFTHINNHILKLVRTKDKSEDSVVTSKYDMSIIVPEDEESTTEVAYYEYEAFKIREGW